MSTVYILGAGASAGFDVSYSGMRCPSAKNFFTVADGILNSGHGEKYHDYDGLIWFLDKYYHLSPSGVEGAGLDMQDVLTFLDLEIEYGNCREEIEVLRRARHQFMDLLSATFSQVLDGPPCPYHGTLASSLAQGDTVISFNYDLLMDTAMELKSPYWEPSSGYGLPASAGATGPGSKVFLLKPHGSFNWAICKTCGNTYVLPFSQAGAPLKWSSLGNPAPEAEDHHLERLLIPPSLKKNVHGRAMRQIWLKALEALKNAERVVVIGYSLPAADFMVKRLLYQSLPFNRSLREFELVDRNNSSGSNPLMSRYTAALPGKGRTVKLVCDKKNIREYSLFLLNTKKQ
ncbi:MAG: hypothetical protein ACYC4H_07415 [Desulfocucumaceae bacterium]